MRQGWKLAAGSCGYNVNPPVYAAYVNGCGLFAWRNGPDSFTAVVSGQGSTSGDTLESAMERAETWANRDGVTGSDRRISRKQFDSIVANRSCLPVQS